MTTYDGNVESIAVIPFAKSAIFTGLIAVHVGVYQCCCARDVESPAIAPTSARYSSVLEDVRVYQGCLTPRMDVDAPTARPTPASLIRVHVSVHQRCRARDIEPPTFKCCSPTGDVQSNQLGPPGRGNIEDPAPP